MRFLALCAVLSVAFALSCVDINGDEREWFAAIKPPKIDSAPEQLVQDGRGLFYIDTNIHDFELKEHGVDEGGVLHKLLAPLYTGAKNIKFAMWNDQQETSTSSTKAHMKGLVAIDVEDGTGFQLVHSTPKFPRDPADGAYEYGEGQTKNGQSFLCLSIDASERYDGALAEILTIARPYFYATDSFYGADIEELMPKTARVIQKKVYDRTPAIQTHEIKTSAGHAWTAYYKNREWNLDFWEEISASTVPYDALLAETWTNGPGKLPSNCTGTFATKNVEYVDIHGDGVYKWKRTHDHSKWAVTEHDTDRMICIGGINHTEPQRRRGGGAICTDDFEIYSAFRKVIDSVEECV